MRQKRLLIVGGGYADIPLIVAAKKLGYYVITSGNLADDMGHQFSDKYCFADFSNPDAILEVGASMRVDAICPCANDFSAISSAYAAEELGLAGHDSFETCKLIHHKDAYRQFALDNQIPTPKAMGFSDLDSAFEALKQLNYPLIIKPVDLTGGKGISRVVNSSEARAGLIKAFSLSKIKRVVVEEFIEGSRHGFSALLQDGRVVFHFMDNEYYYLNPYLVSGASTPADVSDVVTNELIQQTERIASLLALVNGIFHVQYVLADNQPIIIEICRRPPGDLYISLVEKATDLDYSMWIVKCFSGQDCTGIQQKEVNGFILRHCVMADRNGLLRDIEFSPEIQSCVIDKVMWWEPGYIIDNYLNQKFGIVFLKFNSMAELIDRAANMPLFIKPIIDNQL
ncbi:MAG: ATP-grasp domain-containing protein [Candidatus Thiodiazotropha sp. (ex Lucinoma borealis)]|nr:ATP-grasp domain-containing protein [Candidatus Thiodiazotropha sp. (ex Lucinoma borealis)]MCU7946756.1 ATP-grasp domain-containing protein [Candidatus Thiodiazotropha sp. (ex Cardiolucina cf. quadrata)]